MTRASSLSASALSALMLTAACGGNSNPAASSPSATASAPPAAAARAKPNIVFIFTDDMDVGSLPYMPKLQAFVANVGVTFANSFASNPVCCPSRASILRGQYTHNHGVWTNGRGTQTCFEDFKSAGEEASTIATWLHAAGYRTGLLGKYLNHYPEAVGGADVTYIPPGWDSWFVIWDASYGSDAYFNYLANDNGTLARYGSRPEEYETDVVNAKAIDFVKRGQDGKPFFLWVTPTAPHNDPIPAPRHLGAMADKRAPHTPNFNLANISSTPSWYRQNVPLLTAADIQDLDGNYRRRLETLQSVDDIVQNVIDALNTAGILNNTYIFFGSDNGYMSGNHRFAAGKDAPYEESLRVPLLVRGPGVPLGVVLPHDVANIDMAPTFAELAQVQAPAFIDGRSLVPLLSSAPPPVSSWRQDLLFEHEPIDPNGLPSWYALRTDQEKYVSYPASNEEEYYNLVDDPFETESKHRAAAFLSRKSQIVARLNQLQSCAGASCQK